MSVTLRVRGIDQVLKTVADKPAAVQKNVRIVIARYAYRIVATAKKNAPWVTGNLRSEIVPDLEAMAGRVIAGADYSKYVEFGTSRMRAQPFLVPALEEHLRNFYDDIKLAIARA